MHLQTQTRQKKVDKQRVKDEAVARLALREGGCARVGRRLLVEPEGDGAVRGVPLVRAREGEVDDAWACIRVSALPSKRVKEGDAPRA